MSEPFAFSVTHSGRGGQLTCQCAAGVIILALEMGPHGAFSTGLSGARLEAPGGGTGRPLRPEEREAIMDALRSWLDETGRHPWVVEPARPMASLSEAVARQVAAAFPRTYGPSVATHLAQYRGHDAERVREAILVLAGGDLAAVADLTIEARTDRSVVLERAARQQG